MNQGCCATELWPAFSFSFVFLIFWEIILLSCLDWPWTCDSSASALWVTSVGVCHHTWLRMICIKWKSLCVIHLPKSPWRLAIHFKVITFCLCLYLASYHATFIHSTVQLHLTFFQKAVYLVSSSRSLYMLSFSQDIPQCHLPSIPA